MTHIMVGYRKVLSKRGEEVMTYSNSTCKALKEQGFRITPLGEGHQFERFEQVPKSILDIHELFIDLDCGRNAEGNLTIQTEKPPIPSAFRSVDAHGNPTLHKRLAKKFDHVFFAVWDKRDLFTNHPSSHWCPNASDADYFSPAVTNMAHAGETFPFDVGFFGSKHGLDRADVVKEMAERHDWRVDIQEMGRRNHRWPHTAQAMSLCKVLFNKGQKHDGPNQRVIESMLVGRPLVTDRDKRDGMSQLFQEGEHYLGYESESELASQIEWCLKEPSLAHSMAIRAHILATEEHQVRNRVKQIMEVCGV